jgi:hypothetical protein
LGSGANQTKTNAVSENRKAINKIGGKWFMAPFANTKPNPHRSGTASAIRVCLWVSWLIFRAQITVFLGGSNDQHRHLSGAVWFNRDLRNCRLWAGHINLMRQTDELYCFMGLCRCVSSYQYKLTYTYKISLSYATCDHC